VKAPVAVLAIGNRSRGDDAVAPVLLDRLQAWAASAGLADRFDLLEAYQLQPENALDLAGRRLLLFIDAGRAPAGGIAFREAAPAAGLAASHALPPAALLDVFCRLELGPPPPAFVLELGAERFELGDGLSPGAREALEAGWALLRELASDARLEAWRAAAFRTIH
jgi:hydrogenase maturation protease